MGTGSSNLHFGGPYFCGRVGHTSSFKEEPVDAASGLRIMVSLWTRAIGDFFHLRCLQTGLLRKLTQEMVPRVVRLLAAREVIFLGAKWYAILLHPYADPVTRENGLQSLAQVINANIVFRACCSLPPAFIFSKAKLE
jgi:hypothetical protein